MIWPIVFIPTILETWFDPPYTWYDLTHYVENMIQNIIWPTIKKICSNPPSSRLLTTFLQQWVALWDRAVVHLDQLKSPPQRKIHLKMRKCWVHPHRHSTALIRRDTRKFQSHIWPPRLTRSAPSWVAGLLPAETQESSSQELCNSNWHSLEPADHMLAFAYLNLSMCPATYVE